MPPQFASYWFFGGLGDQQKTVLAVIQCHRRVFGIFLAHWNRVCVAQLSHSDDARWGQPVSPAIRDLLVRGGLGDLKKFRGRPGPETGQKHPKSGFSRSWGPFWAKRSLIKFDRMLNADPVNPVWGSICLGPEIWPVFFWGGLGAIASVGHRFCWLGTQPTKKPFWP